MQTLQIKGSQVEVVETLALVEPVSSLCFSPDDKTLLLSSTTVSEIGLIHKLVDNNKKFLTDFRLMGN